MLFQDLVQNYLKSSDYQSKSEQTQSIYSLNMGRLLLIGAKLALVDAQPMQNRVADKRSSLTAIWRSKIDGFKAHDGSTTNSMKNSMLTALKVLYGWGVRNEYLFPSENFTPYIKTWKHEPQEVAPFEAKEMQTIKAAIKSGKVPEFYVPYAKLAIFAFNTGARPDELYEHQRGQVRVVDGDVFYEVWGAKGKAEGEISRLIKLGDEELAILAWFEAMPSDVNCDRFTFRTTNGRPFVQSSVSVNWRKLCEMCGVTPRAFYNLRRGLAETMVDKGYDIYDVAKRLGNTPDIARKHYARGNMLKNARSFRGL